MRLSYSDTNNDGVITASSNPSTNEIIEESNYYPFGLRHKGYNNVTSSNGNSVAQKFKYNGKELSEELGLNLYEYGARMFDPATARFTSIDPKSESYYAWSNYHYAANSPILYIDKNGEGWGLLVKAAKAAYKVGKKAYKARKAGKKFSIKKALKEEALDIVDNVKTLADGELTWDDAIAVVDLATGFGDEVKKGSKALGLADKASDANKATDKVSDVKKMDDVIKDATPGRKTKGRGSNNRTADGEAVGHHTVRNENGSTTYTTEPNNPNVNSKGKGFKTTKRVDYKGAAHVNKKTGVKVETPHVQEKGNVRTAVPGVDMPKN